MVASVEAIFLSTFVLITQNRMAVLADKRADLDLQISLLELDAAQNPELAELSQDVAPEKVMEKMEAHERAIGADNTR
jgi:uncharacterized membrane protein